MSRSSTCTRRSRGTNVSTSSGFCTSTLRGLRLFGSCPDVSVDRVAVNDRAWTPVSHWQTLLSKIAFKPLDTVRHVRPCTPAFTRPHYRGRGNKREICSWSRIDYILVQSSCANRLLSASTLFDAPCLDHRPVVATFALPTSNADAEPQLSLPSTSEFIFRLNPTVFNDQDFVDTIPGVVDEVYRRLEGTAPLGNVYDAALRAVAVAGHTISLSSCRHAPTAGREPIRHGGVGGSR